MHSAKRRLVACRPTSAAWRKEAHRRPDANSTHRCNSVREPSSLTVHEVTSPMKSPTEPHDVTLFAQADSGMSLVRSTARCGPKAAHHVLKLGENRPSILNFWWSHGEVVHPPNQRASGGTGLAPFVESQGSSRGRETKSHPTCVRCRCGPVENPIRSAVLM